jgi:hypothetical protein
LFECEVKEQEEEQRRREEKLVLETSLVDQP